MTKYEQGKIYRLVADETDLIYVGSTKKNLNCRLSNHKYDFKRWTKGTHNYVSSYELVKFKSCRIELIERFPCETRKELENRETYYKRRYIKEGLDLANKNLGKYQKSVQKNYVLKNRREHRKNNKTHCECGSTYYKTDKKRHERTNKHKSYLFDKLPKKEINNNEDTLIVIKTNKKVVVELDMNKIDIEDKLDRMEEELLSELNYNSSEYNYTDNEY